MVQLDAPLYKRLAALKKATLLPIKAQVRIACLDYVLIQEDNQRVTQELARRKAGTAK